MTDQIHHEYGWDAIVREQWAPLLTRLAGEIAPAASEQTPVTPSAPPAEHRPSKLEKVGPPA